MTTEYAKALKKVRGGSDHHEQARLLITQMTQEERLHCLDGGSPFWEGIKDMSKGGYHQRTFPACRIPRLGIPGFNFSDGPRGVVIGPATAFPVSMARGASFDTDLEERIGDVIGHELRAVGATLYGGVCVNLLRHPAWGRAQETYGEDPHHVGEMGAALTRGAQRHVMATVKHFALNSMENARFRVDVTIDERTLHEVYLPHFKRIIDEGVACVMSAYNSVNGDFCGDNEALLTGILRDEWNFDGFVISDWIFGLRDGVKSVRAGLDVEMPYRMMRHAPIVEAVASGELSMDIVDRAVEHTLATMLRFGVGDLPVQPAHVLAQPEHRALAREAAQKSMVLLRNELIENVAVLPLQIATLSRVAVIGELARKRNLGDGGSSDVMAPEVVSALTGIQNAFDGVDVSYDDATDLHQAVAHAAANEIAIVVVGYTKADEGEFIGKSSDKTHLASHIPAIDDPALVEEFTAFKAAQEWALPVVMKDIKRDVNFAVGGDRPSLRLAPKDVELIRAIAKVQPRTIVVIVCGSAVLIDEWHQDVPVVLLSWYCGMQGGEALADILTGAVNPSACLPFVIPQQEDDLVFFDREATEITYEYFHGQWLLDKNNRQATYPFGFGLSYSTFRYSNADLKIDGDAIAVTVDVSNTGAVSGATVLQVYAALPESSIERPRRRLVGFRRVELVAGQTLCVGLQIPLRSLAARDVETHDWWLEDGLWSIEIAQYAGDAEALKRSISIAEDRYSS
ncbi:MAG: hypothetical protein EXQ63_07170 [Ilumatobacteraceae bacterium]|nr:hypothetical protein [Ilumatobacteraceae bacterium]